ncbi:MAG TPA: Stp1/IreP family PP2C-type Ser/Thr phosphatase [Candidatus Sumerlaeota bacterium]|nr:Stp1/IreP family PP2C-type Ser/Thr phosphatase [Candidatus Sumerlaeota bacterium]
MRVVSCGVTDVGMKRADNEDRFICSDELNLYAVADGMGGHAAGEVASETAIATVACRLEAVSGSAGEAEGVPSAPGSSVGTGEILVLFEASVQEANRTVYEMSQHNSHLQGMGTTFTGLWLKDGKAAIAHVGDSRLYLLRGTELRILTTDHSWVNEQLQRNLITEEEARTHRWRNVITRAIGNRLDLLVDMHLVPLQSDDRLLLCSDGLTNMVSDAEIGTALYEMDDDVGAACAALVEQAKAAGGDDNITVVILKVLE